MKFSLSAVICTLYLLLAPAHIHAEEPLTSQQVINALQLQPMSDAACPGYFLPTYASPLKAETEKDRSAASLIHYMMPPEISLDPWHIISSDEIMLYHAGAPLIMLLLHPDGTWSETVLGPDVTEGHVMQHVIPAGTWMGFVKMRDPIFKWGLYGVMVVPGWHIQDIRFITPKDTEVEELKEKYPTAAARGKELGLF